MICVPIVGPTMDQALSDLDQCQSVADMVELRLDLIADYDLPRLMQAAGKTCIVTNRSKIDGGQFRGNEEDRVAALKRAIDQGAEYVDIETSTPGPLLRSVLENKAGSRVILSHHDFTRTPDDINPLYELMCEFPADVLKIITYAQDITDNLKVFQLLTRARREDRKLIAFCMGEKGEISRILSPQLGGFLTFGALDRGKESAPGQIPADTLQQVYRVNELTAESRVFGVIGDPVSKSMGYLIHNRAFRETGLPHVYVPFWVRNLPRFFSGFEAFFSGLSVTMPFKEDIMKQLDRVDAEAARIGAVNTVVREGGDWVGYNTDVVGGVQALEAHCTLAGKKVLILGAGGTARALGHGVAARGAQLTLTWNRNRDKAEALAADLKARLIGIRDIGQEEVDILINCSPVGMSPNEKETPCPAHLLKPGMVVFDSVYHPLETRLIREARNAGCTAIPGIELFVNQAVAQFELWTGQSAPKAAMREVVLDRLSRTA